MYGYLTACDKVDTLQTELSRLGFVCKYIVKHQKVEFVRARLATETSYLFNLRNEP